MRRALSWYLLCGGIITVLGELLLCADTNGALLLCGGTNGLICLTLCFGITMVMRAPGAGAVLGEAAELYCEREAGWKVYVEGVE